MGRLGVEIRACGDDAGRVHRFVAAEIRPSASALKPPVPEGPGEPSAVTQLRNRDSERMNRPLLDSVSYHSSCHLPSINNPIVLS